MALIDKLTAIGNAIRQRTGKSDLLTLDQMPEEIGAIGETVEIETHEWEDMYLSNEYRKWDKEYTNDRIEIVRSYGFAGTKYEVYNLPNVKTIFLQAFTTIGNAGANQTIVINAPNLTKTWGYIFEGAMIGGIILNAPLLNTLGGGTFKSCSYMKQFSNTYIQNIGDNEFSGCTNLETVDLPNLVSAGNNLFESCYNLLTINLSSLTTVGNKTFGSCWVIEEINLPKITSITNQMFYSCNALKKIDLGVNCKTISPFSYSSQAPFYNAKVLDTLILRSDTLIANPSTNTFYNATLIKNGTGFIYVPAALVEEYKAATNWSVYANQIRAIEDYPDICGEA